MTYKLNIIQDQDPESPRDRDNLGTMFCQHGRYNLGDEDAEDIRNDDGRFSKETLAKYIILPLWLYDHSGISISTSSFYGRAQHAEWDSGRVGYIYMSIEKFKAECARPAPLKPGQINPTLKPIKHMTKADRQRAETYLKGEVEVYNQYLNGDVWGFQLIECHDDGAEVETDSCWGFYGNDPATNGMVDHIGAEILAGCEIETQYC